MVADWVKMRTDLYRDPKVCLIADFLMEADSSLSRYVNQHAQRDMTVTRNVMRNVTVGALVSVWGVLRHRGKRVGDDLEVKNCTDGVIDDIADLPGFGAAMASVGWVVETDDGILLPHFFAEFNVDPQEDAKKKAAERARRHRQKLKEQSNVTGRDASRDASTLLYSSLLSSSDPKEEKETIEEITPDRFLPLTRTIQADPRYMNAGQRPLEKYPAIWISPSELDSVFAKFSEVGLKGGRAVFEKVQGKLHGATNGTPKPNAYLWLIGWALKETLQEKKAALDAERSEVYLAKARAN